MRRCYWFPQMKPDQVLRLKRSPVNREVGLPMEGESMKLLPIMIPLKKPAASKD